MIVQMHSNNIGNTPVDLVKSVLDPYTYTTAPPMLNAQSAFTKSIDVSGNFVVNDAALVSERVPTGTGCIIELPGRGAASVWRFGFVPAGAVSPVLPIQEGMGNGPRSLAYPVPVPIPYYDDGINQIKIGPDLSENFSMVRKYSGVLTVLSDTVPIGVTALSGYLSAAAILDTRDVSQIHVGGMTSFDPTGLVQGAVTSKDGIKEISVARGITSLMGPDIPASFRPPMTDFVDTIDGGWTTITTNAVTFTGGAQGANDMNVWYDGWVTPWRITMAGLAGFKSENIIMPDVNLCASVDMVFTMHGITWPVVDTLYGAVQWPGLFDITCVFNDIYAAALPTGAVRYTTLTEPVVWTMMNLTQASVATEPMTNQHQFKHSARTGVDSFARLGMYLGTNVRLTIRTGDTGFTAWPPLAYTSATLRVRANTLYREGELGPARIIRWDNVGNGQTIRVDGRYNVQCIPQGSLAPFTQSSAMFSSVVQNLNAMPFLTELFNGPGPMRRIWPTDDYKRFVQESEGMSPEQFASSHPKLMSAASAAGVFESIGGLVGGLFGPSAGRIGSTIGSLGDRGYGVANKLLGNASGMYGRAAGMYGRELSRAAGDYEEDDGRKRHRLSIQ